MKFLEQTKSEIRNRFQLIKKIQGGSYCKVYIVFDLQDSKQKVLKYFRDPGVSCGLIKEISICFEKDYQKIENVLFPLEYISPRILIYKKMDCDLHDFWIDKFRKYPLEKKINTSAHIFYQLFKGLEGLESLNIHHGDIKEDNAMLYFCEKDKQLKAVWIDFNLAKKIYPITEDWNQYTCRKSKKPPTLFTNNNDDKSENYSFIFDSKKRKNIKTEKLFKREILKYYSPFLDIWSTCAMWIRYLTHLDEIISSNPKQLKKQLKNYLEYFKGKDEISNETISKLKKLFQFLYFVMTDKSITNGKILKIFNFFIF